MNTPNVVAVRPVVFMGIPLYEYPSSYLSQAHNISFDSREVKQQVVSSPSDPSLPPDLLSTHVMTVSKSSIYVTNQSSFDTGCRQSPCGRYSYLLLRSQYIGLTFQSVGNLGQGVKVGVLDTGVDYMHPCTCIFLLLGKSDAHHPQFSEGALGLDTSSQAATTL
jgi:hypothetical protein